MRVVVKLSAAAAKDLHRGKATAPDARAVRKLTQKLGVELTPMHPGVDHPLLRSYFLAEVPDSAAAGALRALQACPGVEAAYPQPSAEPPAG
jgi:hypothetical protein